LQRLLRSMPHGFGDLRVIQTAVEEVNPSQNATTKQQPTTKAPFLKKSTSASGPGTEGRVECKHGRPTGCPECKKDDWSPLDSDWAGSGYGFY
jgi:hypothetical protein